ESSPPGPPVLEGRLPQRSRPLTCQSWRCKSLKASRDTPRNSGTSCTTTPVNTSNLAVSTTSPSCRDPRQAELRGPRQREPGAHRHHDPGRLPQPRPELPVRREQANVQRGRRLPGPERQVDLLADPDGN